MQDGRKWHLGLLQSCIKPKTRFALTTLKLITIIRQNFSGELLHRNFVIQNVSDCSLFKLIHLIPNFTYLHLIIKQKNASPENWPKCTYDPIAFSRRFMFRAYSALDLLEWIRALSLLLLLCLANALHTKALQAKIEKAIYFRWQVDLLQGEENKQTNKQTNNLSY